MPSPAAASAESKLSELRHRLKEARLTGFIVPKADAFQNESVPASEDRLAWLTGFTGSAGITLIFETKAFLLTDSRYTLQARDQTDPNLYKVEIAPSASLAALLTEHAKPGDRIGLDPRLHTSAGAAPLFRLAEEKGFTIVPVETNPIDEIWRDRPTARYFPIVAHDEKYAGETASAKLLRIQAATAAQNAAGLLVTAPDGVAWAFNIRGRDIPHTPVALARAYIPVSGTPVLFVQPGHITAENSALLEGIAETEPGETLMQTLSSHIEPGARVLIDPSRATLANVDVLKKLGLTPVEAADPIVGFKTRKNAVELEGARAAHERDGAALVRFLKWLDDEGIGQDEMSAAAKLLVFRREMPLFQDASFETISGSGPNGAIVHYRVTKETNRPLSPGSLYLIDSGGQYLDGTTDVTRTVAVGEPTAEMKRHFTLVLKGHIAIATARFPAGTRGMDIDPFARRALWEAGLDYGHGTGHGVGSYLSVHEGPPSISRNGPAVLEPGMIVSNEPGYYREGHYGIRIENLLIVTEPEPVEGGVMPMLGFETLTLAPIDRRLVLVEMLSPAEFAWLNAYYQRVFDTLSPRLTEPERSWLADATSPLTLTA